MDEKDRKILGNGKEIITELESQKLGERKRDERLPVPL
jgi:hypothetical protein